MLFRSPYPSPSAVSESLRRIRVPPPYPSPSESLYPGKPLQLPPYPSPSGSLYLQLSPYPSPSAVSESLRRIRVSPSPSAGRRRHHGHTARRLLHLLRRGAGRALPRSILVLPPPHKHWQPVTPPHTPLPRAENALRLPFSREVSMQCRLLLTSLPPSPPSPFCPFRSLLPLRPLSSAAAGLGCEAYFEIFQHARDWWPGKGRCLLHRPVRVRP